MTSFEHWVEIGGDKVEINPGMTVQQLLAEHPYLEEDPDDPVALASINGRRTSLAEPLLGEERIRLIHLGHPEALATIQRTVLFLLAVAAEDLFPDHILWVHFSYGSGMYCELKRDKPLTKREIKNLETRMWELVKEDLPINPQTFGMRALLKIFERRGDQRSLTAAKYIRRDSLTLYKINGSKHLYYGRQLPSTGFVRWFDLVPERPGFVLMTHQPKDKTRTPQLTPQPKFLQTMRDYARWVESIGVQDIGSLNEYIVQGRTADLIQIAEARHAKFFVEAAQMVADLPEEGRLVLVAGPSSSGKTSSAKRLMVQMRVLGYEPFALSLDNYFVNREDTPLDQDGEYDFESLQAIRVDLFNEHLQALMAGEEIQLPRFDFISGKAELAEQPTRLNRGQPLIVEGIHALNPKLTPSIPARDKLKVYVSALGHLNIDNFSYIRTTYWRLFRRIVRDAQFRGYTAAETLARWPKVRQGEERNIFPYQNYADLFFNSGLAYELAVLKLWAEPRLAAVSMNDPNYGQARNLVEMLTLMLPIDASQVPPTSVLREFIGGSAFQY